MCSRNWGRHGAGPRVEGAWVTEDIVLAIWARRLEVGDGMVADCMVTIGGLLVAIEVDDVLDSAP